MVRFRWTGKDDFSRSLAEQVRGFVGEALFQLARGNIRREPARPRLS
jgi:hypothetical protein